MTKSKELVNVVLFVLVAGAALSMYLATRPREVAQTPTFIYQEIRVVQSPVRTMVQPKMVTQSLPLQPAIAPATLIPPRIISQSLPEYPPSALEGGIEGVVLVQARIDLAGAPEETLVKVSSGNAELDAAAIRAVSRWRFSPAMQGGAAVSSIFEVPVRFSIKN